MQIEIKTLLEKIVKLTFLRHHLHSTGRYSSYHYMIFHTEVNTDCKFV